jgi:uroporphyrinogen-III decarboxylase
MPEVGAVGYGVDWRLPLRIAWERLGTDRVIQGNLDPGVLMSSPSTVRAEVEKVLIDSEGRPGHIFNLGHGILPGTPIENVTAMVEAVTACSEVEMGRLVV